MVFRENGVNEEFRICIISTHRIDQTSVRLQRIIWISKHWIGNCCFLRAIRFKLFRSKSTCLCDLNDRATSLDRKCDISIVTNISKSRYTTVTKSSACTTHIHQRFTNALLLSSRTTFKAWKQNLPIDGSSPYLTIVFLTKMRLHVEHKNTFSMSFFLKRWW